MKRPPTPPPATWELALNRFFAHLEREDRSRHTVHHYRDDLAAFAAWHADGSGSPPMPAKISEADVRMWRDHLRVDPLDDAGRVRKPATVNAKLAALKSFLLWAQDAKVIAEAPKPPRRERLGPKAVKALDRKQQQKLLRAAARRKDPRDLALVEVLLETGLRVAELVSLRWCDVPYSARKGHVAVTAGKGRKPRVIPMSPACRGAFIRLRELDPEAGYTAAVFASQRGDGGGGKRPLTAKGVQVLLSKLGAAIGETIHPHLLRHSCAMNMVRRGVQWTVIAKLLGHSSIVTTMSHYGTPSEKDLVAAVDPDGREG